VAAYVNLEPAKELVILHALARAKAPMRFMGYSMLWLLVSQLIDKPSAFMLPAFWKLEQRNLVSIEGNDYIAMTFEGWVEYLTRANDESVKEAVACLRKARMTL